MITVVTFLWHRTGEPQRYGAHHVNALHRALQACLPSFRMVCVAVDHAGLDMAIRHIRMTQEVVDASDRRFLKLSLFRRDAAAIFGGDRLLYVDLDVTPVGDLTPLVDHSDDFVIWQDPKRHMAGYETSHRYNSSLILMNAGCRPQVYETFNGAASIEAVRSGALVGSDQAWIGATLGPDEAVWTQADGVLAFKDDLGGKLVDPRSGRVWPAHARLIVSHGKPKPWELESDHPLRIAYERFALDRVAA